MWEKVMSKDRKKRQDAQQAQEKARARTFPRPLCPEESRPDYIYTGEHVSPRMATYSYRWEPKKKPSGTPKKTSLQQGGDHIHGSIFNYGVRRRFNECKIAVLQVLDAPRQYPEKGTPFAKHGSEEYWIQTTLELHPENDSFLRITWYAFNHQVWANERVYMRGTQDTPPQRTFVEWMGSKLSPWPQ